MMIDRYVRSRLALCALAAASVCVLGCSTGDGKSDSTNAEAALRADSVGELSGAPRSPDAVESGGTASASTNVPSGTKSAAKDGKSTPASAKAGKSSPATPTPVIHKPGAPAADTSAQRRNDGSMTNPPIHRTNPGERTGEPGFDLMAQINALAKTGGCSNASDCQTLPVGRKACGGPKTYVVFCSKSTDVALLKAKIAELDRVDLAAAKNTMSDCMMVMPPRVTLSGGVCRASNAGVIEGP